jgi:hypothetical protein
MASEQDELRLTVTLVDNASAGIASLRNQIQGLSSGQTKQSLDTFQRGQKDMAAQIKELTTAAIGGERALLGYIGKFGTLGVAAAAGIDALKTMSQQMEDFNNLSKNIGVEPTAIKNMVDQLRAVGVSSGDAVGEIKGLSEALARLGRYGSPQMQDLLHASGAYSDIMDQLLRKIENTAKFEDKQNLVRRAASEVQARRYKQDIDMGEEASQATEDAALAYNEFLSHFQEHGAIQTKLSGDFTKYTEEQKKNAQAIIDQGVNVTVAWNQMGAAASTAGDEMLKAFGPDLIQAIKFTEGAIDAVTGALIQMREGAKGLHEGGDLPGLLFGRDKKTGELLDVPKFMQHNEPFPYGIPTPFASGGIVNKKTFAMLGEAGPEAVVPLGGGGDLFGGNDDTKDNTRETADNTKELKRLNDQLFVMLHPGGGDIFHKGLGGLPGVGGPGGGGAPGGGSSPGGGNGGNGDGTSTPGFTTPGPGRPGPEDLAHQMAGTGPGGKFTLGDVQRAALGGGGGGGGDYSDKLAPKLGGKGDPRGLEGYIRQTAAKYGIDPDVAMRVAQSEGLGSFLGDHGKSGGAFQLYTGGGLGNEFQKETGLNPLDPKNEKATIDYALKHAAKSGWGPWHGAARVGIGRQQGIGGPKQAAGPPENAPPSWNPTAMGAPTGAPAIPGGIGTGIPNEVLQGAAQLVRGGNSAQLKQWMKNAGYPQHDNWCGDFVASVVSQSGGTPPSNPSWAMNWHKWGQHAEIPQAGDVITRWNLSQGGHGHVAEIGGYDPKTGMVTVVQGNPARVYQMPLDQVKKIYEIRHGIDEKQQMANPAGTGAQGSDDSAARKVIDSANSRSTRVEATGKLTANINAPPGTQVGVEGGGVFKNVEVNRQVQMMKAPQGPSRGIGHA